MKQKNQQFEESRVFQRQNPHYTQSGFSLIEIMIAAVILSIGILGVVGLQIVGMKGTHQSYMKHQAMSVVQSLTERMRSNFVGVTDSDYVVSGAFNCSTVMPVCNTSSSNCSSADIALIDKLNIICGYKAGAGKRTGGVKTASAADIATFVNGTVVVACNNAGGAGGCGVGDVTITVGWDERAYKNEATVRDTLLVNTRISP